MSIANAASKIIVVIGAGPGTGYSVAKRFAQAGHPVALLSRTEERVTSLANQINQLSGKGTAGTTGTARGYAVDATDESSVRDAYARIQRDFPGAAVWGGVFNANGFVRAPLLDTTVAQLKELLDVAVVGALIFAQSHLDAVKRAPLWNDKGGDGERHETKGFLAFTGATASLKGSANFAAFGAAKAALRSLAQSTAREYAPQGVHVLHTIVDGIIDTESTRQRFKNLQSTFMSPDAIAEAYYAAAAQPPSCWTLEVDLRPYDEKF
ncbi:uncharacterized protein PFL1_04937 [Pseudozyma flocculosa PF-1]|uniref:Related to oxidoreductase, short chain dehydrogenase/reductase family n=2 Tax=Pseudozyma flocculosa TaxID=84751 RepID=A0A5C3EVV7_9BASI|nr:uncharacterized protein PFL1_04937 [Pseudozyma flocculosa PF-1]EPQ27399.1 hypothetical protein PFL1_04937 [Pseudozyma flocculosa PF-1]SPO36182.1 related to oxidoreductase, short chain dehydrogenase/reductase family [Pseudozyma flocculosa]